MNSRKNAKNSSEINPLKKNTKNPNHLANESSPYLRQHMYNPVDWYPWSEEAFDRAKKENKPIFLSIGYSTCHWCHVMEKESFTNEKVAQYLNQNFISIKIDREERPDLDQFFQTVIQITGQSGGWPLTVFLTPGGKPFFAGTYFPMPSRYGRISFLDLIMKIHDLYKNQNQKIIQSGDEIVSIIKTMASKKKNIENIDDIDETIFNEIFYKIMLSADTNLGGIGNAPKFPNFALIKSLLSILINYTSDIPKNVLKISDWLKITLDNMANGGMYDQIGGGFHRYSTDNIWRVPHFEKMLYDNAMAIEVYSLAYVLYGNVRYKEIVYQTIDWLSKEMKAQKTWGFYSAIDADSDGVEGKFYTWSKAEIDEALKLLENDKDGTFSLKESEQNSKLQFVNKVYGFDKPANFNREDGESVYIIERNNEILESLKKETNDRGVEGRLEFDSILSILNNYNKKLYAIRDGRIHPSIDTKILSSWNLLLAIGLYKAFEVFHENNFLELADGILLGILNDCFDKEKGILYEVWDEKIKKRKIYANLDSYAYLINALLRRFNFSQDTNDLYMAIELSRSVIQQFQDIGGINSELESIEHKKTLYEIPDNNEIKDVFYYSSNLNNDIQVRMKSGGDMPLPNGNATMALNFIELNQLYLVPAFLKNAELILGYFFKDAKSNPTFYGEYFNALEYYLFGSVDVAIMSNNDNMKKLSLSSTDIFKILKNNNLYIPRLHYRQAVFSTDSKEEKGYEIPAFADKKMENNLTTYHFCYRFNCWKAVNKLEDLVEYIKKIQPSDIFTE